MKILQKYELKYDLTIDTDYIAESTYYSLSEMETIFKSPEKITIIIRDLQKQYLILTVDRIKANNLLFS